MPQRITDTVITWGVDIGIIYTMLIIDKESLVWITPIIMTCTCSQFIPTSVIALEIAIIAIQTNRWDASILLLLLLIKSTQRKGKTYMLEALILLPISLYFKGDEQIYYIQAHQGFLIIWIEAISRLQNYSTSTLLIAQILTLLFLVHQKQLIEPSYTPLLVFYLIFNHSIHKIPQIAQSRLVILAKDFIRVCYSNYDSRRIGIFFLINLAFMFIELTYGLLSNSLGLITDSFHMLFDCLGLFIGLCASYIAKLPPDQQFSYGYGRVETLSGFFNGVLLIFTAFNVFCESIDRMMEPQQIDISGALLPVSCLGLLVNLIGVFFFHEADPHSIYEEGTNGIESEDTSNENMKGVFLHAMADSLGSLGVIVSTVLVQYFGYVIADPICSFLVAIMILASGIPFVVMTASQLLLKCKPELKQKVSCITKNIKSVNGVVNVDSAQAWSISRDHQILQARITIREEDEEGKIIRRVEQIIRDAGFQSVSLQIKRIKQPLIE